MILLDTLSVTHGAEEKHIELYQGDLTDLTPEEAVDILVVSAFPNDYLPTSTSLIGSLAKKGVSVEDLAKSKAVDLTKAFSCWMSEEIVAEDARIQFKRLLCFEPSRRGTPPSMVGDIFRALAPFLDGDPPVRKIAMPIVASGDQGWDVSDMLPPLVDAAVHWMALGIPVERLKIVSYSSFRSELAQELFAELKERYASSPLEAKQDPEYDVFISYAHEDVKEAQLVVDELKALKPSLRVFMDRIRLDVGAAWQPEIFEAIDISKKVLSLFSPAYLKSKPCKEEFNIAWIRGRESDENYLFPVYLFKAVLPTYMKSRLYLDCREGDPTKLRTACSELLAVLDPGYASG